MNKLIMRHLSNKERGWLASGHGVIVLCTLYMPTSLLIIKINPSSQYVAFGTVNFTWSFVCGIIRHYCRIWNSDFARDVYMYCEYQYHFENHDSTHMLYTMLFFFLVICSIHCSHFIINHFTLFQIVNYYYLMRELTSEIILI